MSQTQVIRLTDASDNQPIHIVTNNILYMKPSDKVQGTAIVIGNITVVVKEPIPLIIALIENRDTLAARILYEAKSK